MNRKKRGCRFYLLFYVVLFSLFWFVHVKRERERTKEREEDAGPSALLFEKKKRGRCAYANERKME